MLADLFLPEPAETKMNRKLILCMAVTRRDDDGNHLFTKKMADKAQSSPVGVR